MLRDSGSVEASSRFQILESLGSGGFGAVYRAIDLRTGQNVAIKELGDSEADSIARFKHEFRALADCHHPNLVGLKELIEENGRWLIVMELVPGEDLLQAMRPAQNDNASGPLRFDETRLRKALIGMAEGLRALHGFGVLHRDLKPSNVRVRPDGRAILLDFGLVTSVDQQFQSTQGIAVGTVRYMAPEQISSAVGPPADLYAFGVCLFEVLAGRAPFEGEHPFQVLLDKQSGPAPLASSFNPDVPADLDALCARLLATAPSERPTVEEVLHVLAGAPPTPLRPSLPSVASSGEVFAGRDIELEHLGRALARTHQAELRIVLVEGESGVGKSELVAEFVRRACEQSPKLTALRGRCYENEQVPYKAFDGCIDELAKLLRRMPTAEAAQLLPVRGAVLGQLFPVLRNVEAIAKAPLGGTSADPTARRLEAFAALAALLCKLAEERPLVLVIDDLQWADAESFRLLLALTEAAERPPLLVLATIRPREELEPEVLAQVENVRKWRHTDVVQLFGLPRAHSQGLAMKLLGSGAPPSWLSMIAEESGGHPLFLRELVQYTQSHDFASRSRITLEAALRSRIERLEWRSRELLEVVALAARPHGSHVFARALSAPDVDESVRSLLAAKLLKLRKAQELGCYHDRIRRTVIELIAKARVPGLHYQLAAALSSAPDADAAEQARHWDLAGESERAIATYELAATRAMETLAFNRAAQLCARALELMGDVHDERTQRLITQQADALACAGRSAEAAMLYGKAADRAVDVTRIRLRSRAAQQLMLSTKVVEGFEAARALLKELGVGVPETTLGTLLRIGWDRLCLAFQRSRTGTGDKPPSERAQLALQVVDELVMVIAMTQPLGAFALTIRAMRYLVGTNAMRARALAGRGWLAAAQGSLASALPLFEKSRKLIEGAEPIDTALQAYAEGSARLTAWDWIGGGACLELAHRLLEEHSHDRPWQITQVRYHLGICWYHQGEHGRLARTGEIWMAEARERNDRLGTALLVGMGMGFLRHLMRDAPEQAVAELEEALAPLPKRPLSFAHFGQITAMCSSLVYQGGPTALRWLDNFEQTYEREFLARTRLGRDVRLLMRGIAGLRAYGVADSEERKLLLQRLHAVVHELRRRPAAYTQAHAQLLSAQLAALEGHSERALSEARSARMQFEALRHGHVRPSTYLEGLLEGGSAGREKQEAALEGMRAQGWLDPLRGLTIAIPVVPLLLEAKDGLRTARSKLLLNRYEIVAPLGSGGFGSVTAARDVLTGRSLALKELIPQGGMPLERFKQEFRALAGLLHANLGRVDALFEHDGRWYIAMELVEGSPLMSYVRPGGICEPARLRNAFLGLARGLSALHDAGFVHRDVKPDNVCIAQDGRAVLLDFGLIARIGERHEDQPIGSRDYAAPEQLGGTVPRESADVYALGACLYEALFGRVPFESVTVASVAAGQRSNAIAGEVMPGLDDVATLCLRMLAPEARERPALAEVLAGLANSPIRGSSRRVSLRPSVAIVMSDDAHETGFAGREAELTQLADAFERTCDDGFTVALVEGESGVGKSALVAEFALRLRRNWPSVQVLRSRCYENEQLAFKAFDSAVDQLAQLLRELPNPYCEALLPRRAALLGQLFPVLTSVPAIAHASRKGLPAAPSARKLAARESFIQLLERLSAQHELLFVVDDLQWADSESFALIRALVEHAKNLPIFFLCTVRPLPELASRVADEVGALYALPSSEHVTLSGLSHAASAKLATRLYGEPLERGRLDALIAESAGHPLFLRELIEHERSGQTDPTRSTLTLNGALRARVASFSVDARELLSLVAVGGRPLGSHVYARAMQRSDLPRDAMIALLTRGLLRRRGDNELACYHDLIRRVVLETLSPELKRDLSRKLALALDGELSVEPVERARLWDEAGDAARAVEAYEEAGERALESLAFGPAEQRFARALNLLERLGSGHDERFHKLVLLRGHALARGGRSAEAARMYQTAASHSHGETKVRLRILAAQHLLQGAQVEDGLRAVSELLDELGLSLPKSEAAALARIAWERARVKLRGTNLKSAPRPLSQEKRLVLETLRGLSSPLRDVSYLPGSTLVAQYLRRALAAGEPNHAARALSYEGLWRMLRAPTEPQEALFDRSRALADTTGDPALIAEVELVRGLACLAGNQFAVAPVHLMIAHEYLQTRCPGEHWLLTSARMYLGAVWFYSGDFGALVRNLGPWFEEAKARDDRYAVAAMAGFGRGSLRHLVPDRIDLAEEELASAIGAWPEEPFATVHLGAALATASVLSYRQGRALLTWLEQNEARWKRAYLMRTPNSRFSVGMLKVWGLALSIERGSAETASVAQRMEVELRELLRNPSQGMPAVSGVARTYLGVVRMLQGRPDEALEELKSGANKLAQLGHYVAPAALYLEGLVEGGESGRSKQSGLIEAIRAEGWACSERALQFRVPGLHLLT